MVCVANEAFPIIDALGPIQVARMPWKRLGLRPWIPYHFRRVLLGSEVVGWQIVSISVFSSRHLFDFSSECSLNELSYEELGHRCRGLRSVSGYSCCSFRVVVWHGSMMSALAVSVIYVKEEPFLNFSPIAPCLSIGNM